MTGVNHSNELAKVFVYKNITLSLVIIYLFIYLFFLSIFLLMVVSNENRLAERKI